MYKFIKLILTSAIISTSGFASAIVTQTIDGEFTTPGGSIESNGKVIISSTGKFNNTDTLNLEGEIEDNGTLNLTGNVTGSGKITGNGKINDGELYKTLTGDELPNYEGIEDFTTVIGMTDSNQSYIAPTVDMSSFTGEQSFISLESKLSTINDSSNFVHFVSTVDSNGTTVKIDSKNHQVENINLGSLADSELKATFGNKSEDGEHAYGLLISGDGTISNDMSRMENAQVLIDGKVDITTENMPDTMIIVGEATFGADSQAQNVTVGKKIELNGKKTGQFTKEDTNYIFDNSMESYGSMMIPAGKTVTIGAGKTFKIGGTTLETGSSEGEVKIVKCGYDYPDNVTWTKGTTSNITGIAGTEDSVNHDDIISMMKLIEATYYDSEAKATVKYSDDPDAFDMSKATYRTFSDGIFSYSNYAANEYGRNYTVKINSSKFGIDGTFSRDASNGMGNITFTITWSEDKTFATISDYPYDWHGGIVHVEGTNNTGYYITGYEGGTGSRNVTVYLTDNN